MKHYIKLLRPKHWAKNLFLFLPLFFAGKFFEPDKILLLTGGFFAFSFLASSIYIINDYRDIEDDKKHPEKRNRPLAAGLVNKTASIILSVLLTISGLLLAFLVDQSGKFLFITSIYYVLNMMYSFGLKNISIIDILILASGFVLRVKGGAELAGVNTTEWFLIMTFLLALFMALAKRRDDVMLKLSTGAEMRKSMKGYSLEFLNTLLALFSAILIVSYINFTVTPAAHQKYGFRLFYTALFVIAALMRYLQITFIHNKAGSPTDVLYKDRFIQVTLVLWATSFFVILYLRDLTFFKK
ncbi:MAG: decaprenyl-phosphate phosphoribosyltransferase [Chitinophagaceae bacterium]|nr:MAG: decaprenyl-phosphate phosphoribosyltransferase [Chitinophagaceae bacterium]